MWNHAESCPVIPWWKDQMSEAHIFFSTFRCHGAGFHFVLLEMHQAAVSERCTNFVLAHSGRGSRSVAGNSNLSAQDYYILSNAASAQRRPHRDRAQKCILMHSVVGSTHAHRKSAQRLRAPSLASFSSGSRTWRCTKRRFFSTSQTCFP